MIQMVKTYDGTEANKKDCRFIKGDFYIKGKQCFLIGEKWYRINCGLIVFDHNTGKYVIEKETDLIKNGIVDYDVETGEAMVGSFSPDPYKNVIVRTANTSGIKCMDFRILPPHIFKEDIHNMQFLKTGDGLRVNNTIPAVTFGNHGYPYNLPYCVKHYDAALKDRFMSSAMGNGISTNVGRYVDVIKGHSFGFEFETNEGKIPNYMIMESGLMPLRDGSIRGIEYATIPLSGKNGISILENACDMLKKYTRFSHNESLHLHIGNIKYSDSKEFIGYLYTLCCVLEKEIYSMFPAWYICTSKFKAKGRDYNLPLRKELVSNNPKETFDNVSYYLNEGKSFQGFGHNHPSDPDGNTKWNIASRYSWCNFIPLLFGDNRTLEFRVHVPTRDKVKCINWLYICSAIIQYAEYLYENRLNTSVIKGVTLDKVIDALPTNDYKLKSYLKEYIALRKVNRTRDEQNDDMVGNTEINTELSDKQLYNDLV